VANQTCCDGRIHAGRAAAPQAWLSRLGILVVAAISLPGCHWEPSDRSQPLKLPSLQSSLAAPNTIPLNVAVVEIQPEDLSRLEDIWRHLDAQSIPLDVRQRLDRNGLRAAIVSAPIPADLQRLIDQPSVSATLLRMDMRRMTSAFGGSGSLISDQQLALAAAQSHWVETSPSYDVLNWSVIDSGLRRVGNCQEATGGWVITPYFQPGGQRVRLRVRPEIHHGQRRPRFGLVDDGWLVQDTPEIITFSELELQCDLRPGQTLAIGPARPNNDLGQHLLTSPGGPPCCHRLLLVRVAGGGP
jgi:hypothetical protein